MRLPTATAERGVRDPAQLKRLATGKEVCESVLEASFDHPQPAAGIADPGGVANITWLFLDLTQDLGCGDNVALLANEPEAPWPSGLGWPFAARCNAVDKFARVCHFALGGGQVTAAEDDHAA